MTGLATAVGNGQVAIEAVAEGVVAYALLTVAKPGMPDPNWGDPMILDAPVLDIWGTSATDLWAVGRRGYIGHFDGQVWTTHPSGTDLDLTGVWGTSSADVWAVGENGTILHYDGSAWNAWQSGTGVDLDAVWGTSPVQAWAVGHGWNDEDPGHRVLLRLTDGAWTLEDSSTGTARDIWGTSSQDVYAVGAGVLSEQGDVGQPQAWHYDGSMWDTSDVFETGYDEVVSVWGTGSDVWAVLVAGPGIGGWREEGARAVSIKTEPSSWRLDRNLSGDLGLSQDDYVRLSCLGGTASDDIYLCIDVWSSQGVSTMVARWDVTAFQHETELPAGHRFHPWKSAPFNGAMWSTPDGSMWLGGGIFVGLNNGNGFVIRGER